ncbi:hypothetical protein DAQ1742_01916 [Dickeya aquatica]|uniref:Uncharacterized protein n=2 Tax=Pectobacteriaceae TaxID=1903410 RepID=A0A375AAA9_9GAMM|nr:hypothetical protein DAQ1742_01916 [Dickeya aquatica]
MPNHNAEIWLQAADDVAQSFLSQPADVRESGSDNGFNRISVLSSLESLADAVYWLDHSLYQFIKSHSYQWFLDGMTQAPEFAINWAKKG